MKANGFKLLILMSSFMLSGALINQVHGQEISKIDLLGSWLSIENNDSVIMEIQDTSRLIFRQKEGSSPWNEIKCNFKLDTANHEQVFEMKALGANRSMYFFIRKESPGKFKIQMYEPFDLKKKVRGWQQENHRNTQTLDRLKNPSSLHR